MSKIKRQLLFKDFFIDTFDSTLNDKNPRTGIALADGKNWNFSYDNIDQVTGAMLNNSGSLLNTYSYNYDLIGNRIQAAKDSDITSYSSNIVNQYTQINSAVPTYDQDGNMLTNGAWSYTWNGENRMTVAQNAAQKVEFSYDYMGRCFERKEYTASNDSWNLDKTVYIVYDDYKQIAEYVNEELHQQYAWDSAGLDTVAFMSKSNSVYMYWTDGNKNVLKLFDTAGEQASYSYDPFGKIITAEGSLATDNPFRFSCEYHNDITGLVEYIYRKYDPAIGRWINRDPLEEQGGVNLYVVCTNSVISAYDMYGQDWIDNIANFSAGVGDSLTMGLTSWLRKRLDIDCAVNYSSGSYITGEVTEFAVETTITLGGSMLRKIAIKYAGKQGRKMLVPATKKLKKLLGVSQETAGQVHHINPIREGRFPLPFQFSSKKWNLEFIEGASRGMNINHVKQHKYLRILDQIDIHRAWSSPIRSAGNEIIQEINRTAGNKKWAASTPEKEGKRCLYAPDVTIEVIVILYTENYSLE